MKRIITESYQDVENYLRSPDLLSQIVEEFGDSHEDYKYGEVTSFVVSNVADRFPDSPVKSEKVIICKVTGTDVDLLDTDHHVINYNGVYYDYSAREFNDSFNGAISQSLLPIVQKIIHSDNQISDKLSTVKGYVILGY